MFNLKEVNLVEMCKDDRIEEILKLESYGSKTWRRIPYLNKYLETIEMLKRD